MPDFPFDEPASTWLADQPTADDADEILRFLKSRGTFSFPTVSSGLFSAAAAENREFGLSGYQNVWTRDNCHIAHALWVTGQKEVATRAAEALLAFYLKHEHRFVDVISGKVDASVPMNRPHIRFDGESLSELDVNWAHAQNDALGYTLWLIGKLMSAGAIAPTPERLRLLQGFAEYFAAIDYWQDEDSGHWEEARKIEASSIGPVVAGLRQVRGLLQQHDPTADLALVDRLVLAGEKALAEILPFECNQPNPGQRREHDAALLFLIEPLQIVDENMASRIIQNVRDHLTGPIGIRRYNGDSYWCANYRDLLSPEVRTADFSDDMSARDSLLQPGQEAQWCIFDPILSVIHGRRFARNREPVERSLQVQHLRRALGQLTTAHARFPAFRCPESYFLERESWIPNDITPLLWTQANLLLALHCLRETP